MKRSIQLPAIIIFISFILLGWQQKTVAQSKEDIYKTISDKVVKKDFVFVAQSLTPMSGQLRVLTSEYDVKVTADSIVSYLPYFGRAQQAPSTGEAGIMFTSTKFDYASETGKKKTWNVTIKIKDQRNANTFSFVIYDNGEASLNVSSMLRDPISFRGHIKL